MKFKHTFNVFVDNFAVTYKQLLYRLIVLTVATVIGVTCLYPFMMDFINSQALNSLIENVKDFVLELLDGNVGSLAETHTAIVSAYEQVLELFQTRVTEIVLMGLLILLLYIVQAWFAGIGNYTTAVIINDKMALRADSPFIGTMISHLKEAVIYNLIYVPLSILYDLIVFSIMFIVLFYMVHGIQFFFISVFLFALISVIATAFKMTFTCDWLPALVRGKLGQKGAIKYAFSRKGKNTLNVYSNFIVLIVIILGLNVVAGIFTFGVGLLLTVPGSYIMIISFELVNYYDREEIRYSVDKHTIIKPDKERTLTREEFFKGSDDNR